MTILYGDHYREQWEREQRRALAAEEQRDKAQARAERLATALRKYGGHVGANGYSCPAGFYKPEGPCECGLDAALAAEEAGDG